MGFRDERANAAVYRCVAALNGHDLLGVSSSLLPLGNIRDLRHPNPVRPIYSDPTCFVRTPTRRSRRSPHGSTLGRSIGRTAEFWPMLSWRKPRRLLAVNGQRIVSDQRIVVLEDRTDG